MTGTRSDRGQATVLAVEEHEYFSRRIVMRVESEFGGLRPCELVRVGDDEVHEVDVMWAHQARPGEYMFHALPRRDEARTLAAGDVVVWDLRRDNGRARVHGISLWDFLYLPSDVQPLDAALPTSIGHRLAHARGWALSPWFDGGEVDSEERFRRELRANGSALLELRAPLAGAAFLESVRSVLHTLLDVRHGRLPSQLTGLLAMVDADAPLARLAAGERAGERARALALARTLTTQTLRACTGAADA